MDVRTLSTFGHAPFRPYSRDSVRLFSFSHCPPSQCLSVSDDPGCVRYGNDVLDHEDRVGRGTYRCVASVQGPSAPRLSDVRLEWAPPKRSSAPVERRGPVDKCLPKTVWHGSSGMLLSGPHRPFPYPAGRDPCGILILRLHCEMSPPRHGHVFGFGWNDRSVHPRGFPSRPGVVGRQENRPIGRVPRVRFLGILRSPRSFARYDLHS